MANHPSAEKRNRVSKRRNAVNTASLSKVKTLVKKTVTAKTKAEGEAAYRDAVSYLDKVAAKKRMHKNTVARKKSQLTKFVAALPAEAKEGKAKK